MSGRKPIRRKKNRSGLYAALAAIGVVAVLAIAAVVLFTGSSGDDDEPEPANPDGTAATAQEAVPDLEDLGYDLLEVGRDPAVSETNDMARARYAKGGTERKEVLLRIYYAGSPEEAFELYTQVTQAYAVMPIQVLINADPTEPTDGLPGGPANVILPSGPAVGGTRASYQTAQSDSNGNAVWTDVYLEGTTVFAVQVLDTSEWDSMPTRTTIAERIEAVVPQ